MRRRELMLLLGGAALLDASVGRAQEPGRVYRLGIMSGLPREDASFVALFDELRRSGFVEGAEPAGRRPLLDACRGGSGGRSDARRGRGRRDPDRRRSRHPCGAESDPDDPDPRHRRRSGAERIGELARPSRWQYDRDQHSRDRARRQAAGAADAAGSRSAPYRGSCRSRRSPRPSSCAPWKTRRGRAASSSRSTLPRNPRRSSPQSMRRRLRAPKPSMCWRRHRSTPIGG